MLELKNTVDRWEQMLASALLDSTEEIRGAIRIWNVFCKQIGYSTQQFVLYKSSAEVIQSIYAIFRKTLENLEFLSACEKKEREAFSETLKLIEAETQTIQDILWCWACIANIKKEINAPSPHPLGAARYQATIDAIDRAMRQLK